MNKYKITIQPVQGPEVSYKVGGFDREDAFRQGVDRWLSEDDNHNSDHIAEVFVEPLKEESEVQLEAQLYGRRRA